MTRPAPSAPPGPALPAPPSPPPPVRSDPAAAPDADFAALLADALTTIRAQAPGWTDHNPGDPGVTLLESVVWSVADLHYRTGNRPLSGWSAETGLFRSRASRHWSGVPLPKDPAELRRLGELLAVLGPADRRAVREATGAQAAEDHLAAIALPGSAKGPGPAVSAAVRLLRAPLLLQAAMDADAADGEAGAGGTPSGPLFPGEQDAVRERRRRMAVTESLRAAEERIRALVAAADGEAALEAVRTTLAAEFGLTKREAADAVGCHPAPPGAHPESWEDAEGFTTHWPPHPLQACTVEPVTTGDYARLAVGLSHELPGDAAGGTAPRVTVDRAWAVPGVLPGIGFDGLPTGGEGARPGAVTILVAANPASLLESNEGARHGFLRAVLAGVLSPAPHLPAPPVLVEDPGESGLAEVQALTPRRLMGDEVGAALLETRPVRLRGALYVPVTASPQRVLRDALRRVAALLADGRTGSAHGPDATDDAAATKSAGPGPEGPWPRSGRLPSAPGQGWQPGEPVRIAELVQVISADPEVLGVMDLAAATGTGEPDWDTDELLLLPYCVPVLDPDGKHCLAVRPELPEEDARGC